MVKKSLNYQEAGQKLKERRIFLNRELKQVSSDLKVSLEKLEALESGDVGIFNDLLFYQLFYSTYARYLGLDEEKELEVEIPEQPFPEEKRKLKLKVPLVYFIIPVVLVVIILTSLVIKDNNPEPINGSQPPLVEEKPPVNETIQNPPVNQNPPVPEVEKVVVVKLSVVKDKCWLQVNIDGNQIPVFRKTLFAGEEIEFRGEKEVRLWIGNAGVLKIVANGIEQPTIGKVGEVIKDLVFTPPER